MESVNASAATAAMTLRRVGGEIVAGKLLLLLALPEF
jgi:hypothetical protein